MAIGESWQFPYLIMFLPGLLPAVVAVLIGMAVCKSRFGYWAGVASCLITGVWLLISLQSHLTLTPRAYSIMAIPMPIGLLAILLSFRPAFWWLGEIPERPATARTGATLSGKLPTWIASRVLRVSVVLICAGVALGCWYDTWWRPRRDFGRLLRGDKQVAIVALEVQGYERPLALQELSSLEYLSKGFRAAVRGRFVPGVTYHFKMRLSTGGQVECSAQIPDEGNLIGINFPLDALNMEPEMYVVTLPEALPKELASALAELRGARGEP